jgi:hypothetical protein
LRFALPPDHWLAVPDEIRQGRCYKKQLTFWMVRSSFSAAAEAVKAVESAIKEYRHLESLELRMENGFTDEAGVALIEALTTNKTLRRLILDDSLFASAHAHTKSYLGGQSYEAFGAMLRVNTSLVLIIPPLDADVGDEMDIITSCRCLLSSD